MGKPEGLGWAGIKLGDLLEKSCSWTTRVPAAVVMTWLLGGLENRNVHQHSVCGVNLQCSSGLGDKNTLALKS